MCHKKFFLFNSSIRNNICFKDDKEDVDEKKLNEIFEICELKELVNGSEKRIFR